MAYQTLKLDIILSEERKYLNIRSFYKYFEILMGLKWIFLSSWLMVIAEV